jgi:hypothetical protein
MAERDAHRLSTEPLRGLGCTSNNYHPKYVSTAHK